jgi:hypothetical protein
VKRRNLLITVLALVLAMQASSMSAFAHERREVADTYEFRVGSLTEPLVTSQMNGIDLRITNTQLNQLVEGVQETLQAELMMGQQTKAVTLQARPGMPAGNYTAPFISTQEGTLTFRFHGTIEGMAVDEQFDVRVRPAAELEFPQPPM